MQIIILEIGNLRTVFLQGNGSASIPIFQRGPSLVRIRQRLDQRRRCTPLGRGVGVHGRKHPRLRFAHALAGRLQHVLQFLLL